MQPELHTEFQAGADGIVVTVGGEIDMSTCGQLQAAIDPHIRAGVTIALDLAGVTFVDSSAIRVMIEARNRAVAEGAGLSVRAMSDPVRRVLTVAGVLELFAGSDASA